MLAQAPPPPGESLLATAESLRQRGAVAHDRSSFDAALAQYLRALDVLPDDPRPWYGLGTTKIAMWRAHFIAKVAEHQPLGQGYLDAGAEALARAAQLEESDSAPAAIALTRLLLDPRLAGHEGLPHYRKSLLDALRRMAPTSTNSNLLIAWGDAERGFGRREAATSAYRRAAALPGAPAVAQLALARILLTAGDSAGDSLYFALAANDDAALVAGLRADLAWIADSTELAEFDSARGDQRAAMLHRFWRRRDNTDFRRPGERLREHYRRLDYARHHYRLVQWPRRYEPYEIFHSTQDELDDRGVVYVRQGKPDTIVTAVAIGACYNQSWAYRRPGGSLALHFLARTDPDDYRLVESVFNLDGGQGYQQRLQISYQSCSHIPELLLDEVAIAPLYSKLITTVGPAARKLYYDEWKLITRSIRVGTTTDRFPLRFPRVLHPTVQIYTLLSRPGARIPQNNLLVTFAVPGNEMVSQPAAADPKAASIYRLDVRIATVDSNGVGGTLSDSLRRFVTPQQLTKGEYLQGFAQAAAAPGITTVGVILSAPDAQAGQVSTLAGVMLPDPDSAGVQLSDIILGRPGSGLTWTPPGGTPVPLNPLNAFPPGGTVALYYQVGGLAPGARYRTDVSLAPADDPKGRAVVTLSSADRAECSWTEARRTVSLARLNPGHYRLTVRVTGADGQTATRSGLVNIVKE